MSLLLSVLISRSWLFFSSFTVATFAIIIFIFNFLLADFTTVVLLQDADEVRATGGFLGSVAVIKTRLFSLQDLQFIDIYNLDHQLAEHSPAPAGVKQYLSGGLDVLYLQDANWDRDFPLSARRIGSLLVDAGLDQPDFIVAVNSRLLERVISNLGGFTYDKNGQPLLITADNFSLEARRDHQLFSAHRQPKTDFLTQFSHQLFPKIMSLPLADQFQLAAFIWQQHEVGYWQAFAYNSLYQRLFQLLGISGHTSASTRCHSIYFVPSNVGINKSNKHTQTDLSLVATPDDPRAITLTAHFYNHNPLHEEALVTERLHFANYQRVLLPPDVTISHLAVDGIPITDFDQRQMTDSSGNSWQEIGFLIVINEQAQSQLTVQLQSDQPGSCWQIL